MQLGPEQAIIKPVAEKFSGKASSREEYLAILDPEVGLFWSVLAFRLYFRSVDVPRMPKTVY